ncbi:MAG: PhoH family protein [Chthoniobacteraceae bacterium]|nr:PhoH family protein [Chthoniobacteraceae bacterium]
MPNPKTRYVLDTCVILEDPQALFAFGEHDVVIPVEVLSETDKKKTERSEIGANAREFHRLLEAAMNPTLFPDFTANPERAIPTPGGGNLFITGLSSSGSKKGKRAEDAALAAFDGGSSTDNRILCVALRQREALKGKDYRVVLVSNDIALRLKAQVCGLVAEKYRRISASREETALLSESIPTLLLEPTLFQRFATKGTLELEPGQAPANRFASYVLVSGGVSHAIPARICGHSLRRLKIPKCYGGRHGTEIRPRNLEQTCFYDALLDPEIQIVTAAARAGTGKTLLSVNSGLMHLDEGTYHKICVARATVGIGKDLGALPGGIEEKLFPWTRMIYDALDRIFTPAPREGGRPEKRRRPQPTPQTAAQQGKTVAAPNGGRVRKPFDYLLEQGLLEIEPLYYLRGRSIPNAFFIVDEVQNVNLSELKTIATRMGEGSKLVLIGDPSQIDAPYLSPENNGLVHAARRFAGQPMHAHIALQKGERSPLAELSAKLL